MLVLKNQKLRTEIWQISWPAMVEMIMYMIVGIVDVAIVGRLGAAPLAAVGLGAEIFFSIVLLFEALSTGSSVLIAQARGAKNYEQIASIILHTVIMAIITGTITGIIGLNLATQIIELFSVEKSVHDQALHYLLITFKITPFAVTLYMLHSIFRGLGRTDIPMKISLVMNIFNAIGDYILVYGKLGLPALGVAGAAYATSFSHILGVILAFYFFKINRKSFFPYKETKKTIKITVFRDILTLGIPSLGENFFWSLSNIISIFLIVHAGTLAYASHQLAVVIESISFMPGFGIAVAASVLVGHSIGAKDRNMTKKYARGTIEFAVIIMGFFGLLFALLPHQIVSLFTNDQEIIGVAGTLIRIASLEQITMASSMVMGGILRGSGNTRTPMLIITLFTWGFRLPLTYFLIIVLHKPVTYVWIAFVIDWTLRTLVYSAIILRQNWLNKALEKQANKI
ncbi:MATE family efflux transporter [Thermosyntropha sp.]|uniref:MATE family efflux transporter n=1 Tax=Thermosyntropha sp. TaxID=2740820 RepID=UPI0025D42290|nr:MATE family efflux transporter [Thermosyntropha sp.]MBO8158563.1 MATE family efflux transporter [Thermosyntropha sp.]